MHTYNPPAALARGGSKVNIQIFSNRLAKPSKPIFYYSQKCVGLVCPPQFYLQQINMKTLSRPGVDKVKPEVWFEYSL